MECTCPSCKTVFEQKVTRKKKTPKETDPRVAEIIRFYSDTFWLKFGEYPHLNFGACGKVAKSLIATSTDSTGLYDGDKVYNHIKEYIDYDDKFFKEAGYPFLLLPNYIQKKAVQKPKDSIPEWKKGPV